MHSETAASLGQGEKCKKVISEAWWRMVIKQRNWMRIPQDSYNTTNRQT